jgi:MFS family permease
MNGAGGAAGTLLGGIITQELTWRWVLLINLPIGIAGAALARVVIVDRRREDAAGSFDLGGALTVTGGLLALVYGIVNAGSDGWGSLQALGPIAGGLLLLAAFFKIEGSLVASPLVPLRVFSNRLLRVSNIVVVLFSAAVFPMWYFSSLYLQEILHLGPLDAGLAFLPMALTIMACATQAGALVGRFGAGAVLTVGLTLMAAGLALFGLVSVGGEYVTDFMGPSLLVAVGIGLSIVPSTIAATSTAAPSEAGLVSGLVNTSRQMGGALGLAILASLSVTYTKYLVDSEYSAQVLAVNDGFRLAFYVAAGFTAIAALIAYRYIPRPDRPAAPPPAMPTPLAEVRPLPVATPAAEPLAAEAEPASAPAPEPLAAAEPEPASPGPAVDAGPPDRAPRRRVASVTMSAGAGVVWAIAPGSMTVTVTGAQAQPGMRS